MPYESKDIIIHPGVTVVGRVSKYGSRILANPLRIEFDILCKSQRRSMFCARVTVYDPGTFRPMANDYVEVSGLPDVAAKRMSLMAFGKDVTILNRWISKKEKSNEKG